MYIILLVKPELKSFSLYLFYFLVFFLMIIVYRQLNWAIPSSFTKYSIEAKFKNHYI